MSQPVGRAFLGVDRSVSGRRWAPALDERSEASTLRMVQQTGLPEIVCRVLAARGVSSDAAAAFLAPTVRDLMPDPSTLTDMDAAALRLADAIDRDEQVAIFGDYDVDGAASAALLWRYLTHFGIKATIRIPDRITEGYGPTVPAIREMAATGATLIVTVDCGTTSHAALASAHAAGVDVLVLDHHQTADELPSALAIVNPNRQDDLSGQGHLAAVGVVFLTLTAVSRELRRRGRRTDDLPNLLDLLDLVALATVCDVVPLIGVNRAFINRGLAAIMRQGNAGLAALSRVAGIGGGPIDCYHLGFILGPRINAGGRIGQSDLGARLLTLDDEEEAATIADELQSLNEERQRMERSMLAEAEAEVAAEIGEGEGPSVLVAANDRWHPGIVGLIAARLKERYRRPAFAIAFDESGKGTGSGRSIAGFDLGSAVRRAVAAGLLDRGGGHAMAAGVTIRRDRLADLRAFLDETARTPVSTLRATDQLRIDAAVNAGGLTLDLYAQIERAGPFGSGHPQPVFAMPRHSISNAAVVGAGHVRAGLAASDGSTISVIAFRAADSDLGRRLLQGGDPLHVAGTLAIDRYRGRESVTLRLIDIAEAGR